MDLERSLSAIHREYPEADVLFYLEHKGRALFGIGSLSIPEKERLLDIHDVDQNTFSVSGSIPTLKLFEDPSFILSLQKAKPVKEKFLAHHGIKGQKWGVRNGPPYPLDKKQKPTQFDTKKVPGLKKAGTSEYLLLYLASLAVTAITSIALNKASNFIQKHRLEKDWKDQQLTILEDSKELEKKGVAESDTRFSDDSPPKKIQGQHSIDDDLAAVNPSYDEKNMKTCNNCVLCSSTYDLRRRGYDVTARLSHKSLYTDLVLSTVYEGLKQDRFEDCNSFNAIENKIVKNYGEGSRGIIQVGGFISGLWIGHAMSFEVSNGKMMILDSQANKKFDSFDAVKQDKSAQIMKIAIPEFTNAYRLDDKKVNINGMNLVCMQKRASNK